MDMKVLSGIVTYMSRDCPKTEPSAFPTPTTRKGRPSTFTDWPRGLVVGKSFSAARAQRREVFERHVLVAPPRGVQRLDAGEIFDRKFLHAEGVRPDVGDLLVNVGVEAFDERDDDDH